MEGEPAPEAAVSPVEAIYGHALPQVYGYLLPRCGSVAVAEDLTSETFMAAVVACRDDGKSDTDVSVGWLVGIARHKLVDHWRRSERERRGFALVEPEMPGPCDPWDQQLEIAAVHAALARLPAPQRTALVLRYLDGLPVPDVAGHLGRSVRATETLLVRARAALRRVYEAGDEDV